MSKKAIKKEFLTNDMIERISKFVDEFWEENDLPPRPFVIAKHCNIPY